MWFRAVVSAFSFFTPAFPSLVCHVTLHHCTTESKNLQVGITWLRYPPGTSNLPEHGHPSYTCLPPQSMHCVPHMCIMVHLNFCYNCFQSTFTLTSLYLQSMSIYLHSTFNPTSFYLHSTFNPCHSNFTLLSLYLQYMSIYLHSTLNLPSIHGNLL